MANVPYPPKALPSRRAAYSADEDKEMWDFFVEKIRKRNPDAVARRANIWAEFAMVSKTKRSYQTLEKHFREILLPRIDIAPIDDEDVMVILELCKINLADNDSQRNLKRRLRKHCELNIVRPNYYVQKVVRLENKHLLGPLSSGKSPSKPFPPVPGTQAQFIPRKQHNGIRSEDLLIDTDDIVQQNGKQHKDGGERSGAEATEDDSDVVDDSFHSADLNQPLGDDEEYRQFIEEIESARQPPKKIQLYRGGNSPKKQSQKQPIQKTLSNASAISADYELDLSGGSSSIPLQTVEEQSDENDEQIEYETASNHLASSSKCPPSVAIAEIQLPSPPSSSKAIQDQEKSPLSGPSKRQQNEIFKNKEAPALDEETVIELEWHKELTKKNKGNRGVTALEVLQCKELLRSRIKLTAKGLLSPDLLLEGIPESVQGMVSEFARMLKWCLSNPEPTSQS